MVCRGFVPKKEANRGLTVPVPEKIPQFGAHNYLILLTLVRLGSGELPVRSRLSTAFEPLWCRLKAGRSYD